MIALIEAQRAGLFSRSHWGPNIIAGIIVGVVALPLAMAFAIASGVKPEQGLYTAIVAGLAVSIFGGSRVQIAGPTGAFIVLLSGIVAQHGVGGLQIATLMAGIILCAFGMARMGAVIRYIPLPVILGFTAGIGVIIFVGQWEAFFGLVPVQGHYFHEKLWFLLRNLPHFDGRTTLFGFGSLALLLLPRWVPRLRAVPGPLLALIVATLIQGLFQFPQVATIGSAFGDIPRGLPQWTWPHVSVDEVLRLIGPAFAIAMLGAIESLLSAVVADGMAGTRHHSNAELLGQGIANILSPLFGGIAATGAIARTATNIRSGGTSPLAGIVHALVLVLVLLLLAPLARHIPLATLAAILFMVAWNMSEAARFLRLLRRAPRADVVILLVTFLLTIFADLVVAVNIGIVLAVLHFLRRMAASVEVVRMTDDMLPATVNGSRTTPSGVDDTEKENVRANLACYEIHGPLFFAAVDRLTLALAGTPARALVISLEYVPFADATALQALDDLVADELQRGVRIVFCHANDRVARKFRNMGLADRLGPDGLQPDLASAIAVSKA